MLDQGRNTLSVRLLRGFLLAVMRLLFRIEHCGLENIPRNGPLVITPNHVTYFDPFWVSVRMYRAVRFMAWDRIFDFPVAGSLFRWLGAFPVSLENPEFSAYKTALKILRQGEALMIFPEGGRSPDGRLLPFKDGAARLALKSGAAILPVAIHGGANVWSSQMLFPRPAKVRVHYLPPIVCPAPEPGSKAAFEQAVKALTEQIRMTIEQQSAIATIDH